MSSSLPQLPNNALRPSRVEFERTEPELMEYPMAVLRELSWITDLRLPLLCTLVPPELSALTRLHTLRIEVPKLRRLDCTVGVFPSSLTNLVIEPSFGSDMWRVTKAKPTLPLHLLIPKLSPTLVSLSLLGCITDIDVPIARQQECGTALQLLELPKRYIVGPEQVDQLAELPHLRSLLCPGGISVYRGRYINFVPAFPSLVRLATRFVDEQSALIMANVRSLRALEVYGRTAMLNPTWLRGFHFPTELIVARVLPDQVLALGGVLMHWTSLVVLTVRLPPPEGKGKCDWRPVRLLVPLAATKSCQACLC